MKKISIMIFIFAFSMHLFAGDLNSDLDAFITRLGYDDNSTNSSTFESQASGHYTGGALCSSSKVREYHLATIDLPDFKLGCSGIDLHMGGLSFISGEKLTELGKAVMTNTGAYAVDVMLASTVPELKQVRDYLQSVVQKINQLSINSCETSQSLVGGIWPKVAASQQKICIDQRRLGKTGLAHDYIKARMECASDGFQEGIANAAHDARQKNEVVINRNIIWSLLMTQPFLKDNTELAEMVMSLTGTYIIDNNGQVQNIPSLLGSGHLIQALIGSLEDEHAQIWGCADTTYCMSVSLKELTITKDKSLHGKIRLFIENIYDKLKKDVAMDAREKNFLRMTSLPVLKFLSVMSNTHYGDVATNIDEYSGLIAQSLIRKYLDELLELISKATISSSLNEALTKDIQTKIEFAEKKIADIEPNLERKLSEKLALINNVARVEKELASHLSGLFK